MNTTTCAAAAIGAAVISAAAVAQTANYPNRVVKFIVPVAAGGTVDIVARTLAQRMTESLGLQVIVENRPSASSLVGTQVVAKSAPDGYTLLATSTTFLSAPAVVKDPGYDPLKDFAPISDLVGAPNVIAARADLGLKSFADLVTRARARPGALNFATPGTGSISHLGAELLKIRADIALTHVPFTGAGPAMQAVLGGTVELIGVTVATAVPQHKAGALIALVQTGHERWADLPDVPTLAEAGVPNSESETLQSLYAPAGTPTAVIERLTREVVEVLKRPEVRAQLAKANFRVLGDGPQAQQRRLARDVATWKEVINKAGIKLE
jgi:tripartite-type tricarboxylate transporter receptor subunit TctC